MYCDTHYYQKSICLDGIFWQVPGQHYHSLEATGYAVLALVMAKDFERAGRAVRWLGKQQTLYGGYGTTQVFHQMTNE